MGPNSASGSWMSSWKAAMKQKLKRKKLNLSLRSFSAWHFSWLGIRVSGLEFKGAGRRE